MDVAVTNPALTPVRCLSPRNPARTRENVAIDLGLGGIFSSRTPGDNMAEERDDKRNSKSKRI